MSSEASVIARKLQNFLVIENEPIKKEPGFFTNLILVLLMGSAVILTQMTLFLVKLTKRIEAE
jgi:hypothetical protein